MISYWERQSLATYDYIIIGAGFMGWNMAIEIQEARPQARVLVLEQSLFSGSASLRNAGFACMGSLSELLGDLKQMSEEAVISLFRRRMQGLAISRRRYGEDVIAYEKKGSYEILFEGEEVHLEEIDAMNQRLMPITGTAAFARSSEKMAEFGFSPDRVKALIENRLEACLDSGKLWLACMRHALRLGVECRTGARVREWTEDSKGVNVLMEPLPWMGEKRMELKTGQLFLCTNAHASQLLDGLDLEPGRGQVLITKPLPELNWEGCFHFDAGYYYFRSLEGRLLLGGGRNLDFEGERVSEHGLHPGIHSQLEAHIREWILVDVPYEVDSRWSGIMGFGSQKTPILMAASDRVFTACRLGGMGVALAPQLAKELWAMTQSRGASHGLEMAP